MKESLFEMLIHLFERSLAQIKKGQTEEMEAEGLQSDQTDFSAMHDNKLYMVKAMEAKNIRVFTEEERFKLTKSSYQFLMRMRLWGILHPESFEIILNQLMNSDALPVSLEETKWMIKQTLAGFLEADQLAFLDLVLYQKDKHTVLH